MRTMICLCLLALGATAQAAATLRPYRDEAEFNTALDRWRAEAQRVQGEQQRRRADGLVMSLAAPAPAAAPAVAQQSAARMAGPADNGITNVQTAGVDEGGIVKRAGDFLVVLRRGRLFTVRVGGDQLQPVASTEAYAPGSDPRGAWYDELLISGRQVVVIGYSVARGGTEIGLFDLAPDGTLAYRATHHLRSFDYYASRNYASRLVGRKLLFYAPTLLQPWSPPMAQMLPAQRRWNGAVPEDFERILPAARIYRSDDDFDPREPLALHTVTSCDLGAAADGGTLRCEATAVLGPQGRVFYVSAGSVYVWTNTGRRRGPGAEGRPAAPLSAVFRLPLDGAVPTALKTAGVPLDAQSFLEDGQGWLNVLVAAQGDGEGMWGAERSRGAVALLRVPLVSFADGRTAAPREAYSRLPGLAGGVAQNRYVGDWLLWGGTDGAWATRYAQSSGAVALDPGHAVARIEALGNDAVLVGNAGADLRFSAVRLGRGDAPGPGPNGARIEGRHTEPGSRQGETRTHGFFYRATGADEGLLGLPVLATSRGQGGAAVVVLRQRGLAFTALGALASQPGQPRDDGCKASCVDWYGNARPIFIGDRVLALMGYEIVEGRLDGRGASERIGELRRISFAPAVRGRGVRPTPFE